MSEQHGSEAREIQHGEVPALTCESARENFSDYLDGALDGHTMGDLAAHLDACADCHAEFEELFAVQQVLGQLGPAEVPTALQVQLRDALADERRRGSFLSPLQRLASFNRETLTPIFLRASAGFAAAMVLLGTTVWIVGSAAPVQANDDRMADLHGPRFLYAERAPQPIASDRGFVAVMVQAKVDARGRVYDYAILQGPADSETRARVEANLLNSVFTPATIFGEPVPGSAMITYTVVSVHG